MLMDKTQWGPGDLVAQFWRCGSVEVMDAKSFNRNIATVTSLVTIVTNDHLQKLLVTKKRKRPDFSNMSDDV
jgi:hypothetical protein